MFLLQLLNHCMQLENENKNGISLLARSDETSVKYFLNIQY